MCILFINILSTVSFDIFTGTVKQIMKFTSIVLIFGFRKRVFLFVAADSSNLERVQARSKEGGELDSQGEASPEEIKSREVVLGY